MYGNKTKRRGGFTLTELLVVIGLIAVLMGILIPVAGTVRKRAYQTRTAAMVQKLASACHAYYNDFQAYPGIIDDAQLYGAGASFHGAPTDGTTGSQLTNADPNAKIDRVTSSENLLLSLLGGTKIDNGSFKFDLTLVQAGGLQSLNTLNPKAFGAYLPFNASEVSAGKFYDAFTDPGNYDHDSVIPEFMDAFPDPLPIIYIRARPGAHGSNGVNPIAGAGAQGDWQYNYQFLQPYWRQFGPPPGTNSPQFPTYDKPNVSNVQPVYNDPVALFASPSVSNQARGKDTFIIMATGASRNFGTKDMIISAD
ncbi:MAG TPA: type II secretion system protein [Humisphaera sp.]|jgi:prepilin-type N-terminal cleavage/methylation domain-containing protein|nr:type II secretion system protein [Humisphaera sp.]